VRLPRRKRGDAALAQLGRQMQPRNHGRRLRKMKEPDTIGR
jgi:hypothetical protein